MAKEPTELIQTKNAFKVIGKVTRIDKDYTFKEGVAEKGKHEGENYRALKFGVKTSETNEISVEMFDYEPTEVYAYSSDKKSGKKFPFSQWEKLGEKGYAILQTRVGLTYGSDGKLESRGLPSYVASEKIYETLNNGDTVVIEGEIRYSEYEGQDGKMKERKSYVIKKVFKLKDIDFDAEDFEEVTYFEQQIVFIGSDIVKKEKKVYVTGRVIDYMKNFHDTQMIIDFSDGNGGNDADMVKLADAFVKKFKFGDVINVFGDTVNRVIVAEVENKEDKKEDKEEDLLSQLGGKKKPKHAEGYVNRTYISELQVHGVNAWDKKVYKEEDFVKDELIVDEEDELANLGGKKKNNNNPFKNDKDDNPFADDEEEIEIDISDDDLPF